MSKLPANDAGRIHQQWFAKEPTTVTMICELQTQRGKLRKPENIPMLIVSRPHLHKQQTKIAQTRRCSWCRTFHNLNLRYLLANGSIQFHKPPLPAKAKKTSVRALEEWPKWETRATVILGRYEVYFLTVETTKVEALIFLNWVAIEIFNLYLFIIIFFRKIIYTHSVMNLWEWPLFKWTANLNFMGKKILNF